MMVKNPESVDTTGIRVFVYGSLKTGHGNNRFLREAELIGKCIIRGKYKLIDLGYYPGLVQVLSDKAAESAVLGEVYKLKKEHLDGLDMLEGHPDYYRREKVQTPWKGAWCYFLPSQYLTAAPHVPETEGVQVWKPNDEEVAYVCSNAAGQ